MAHFSERLDGAARAHPDKLAFGFLGRGADVVESLTFGQLRAQSLALAVGLRSGLAPGDVVLIVYRPGLHFVRAFFACLYSGLVPIPVYPPPFSQDAHVLRIIQLGGAVAALGESKVLGESPEFLGIRAIATDRRSGDQPREPDTLPWTTTGGTAFLQFTSGTLSDPKGVIITHDNLLRNAEAIQAAFQDDAETVTVSWLPPYHDMGLIGTILQPVYLGVSAYLMSPFDFVKRPLNWLLAISRYRGTTCGGPDFGYGLCVDAAERGLPEGLDLSCWTLAFTGAERVRERTIDRFHQTFSPLGFEKRSFLPCYGMAETTLFISGVTRHAPHRTFKTAQDRFGVGRTLAEHAGDDAVCFVSCGGTPAPGSVLIVDPETGAPLPERTVGEVWYSGPNVGQGYHGAPAETERTFRNPCDGREYLRTGDLGFLDGGELFPCGRIKEQLNIRGKCFAPQDVEDSIRGLDASFRDGRTAVIAVDTGDGEGFCVLQEIRKTEERRINVRAISESVVAAVLEAHRIAPTRVLLLRAGSIPVTSSGKIQRVRCRALLDDPSRLVPGAPEDA